MYIYIHKLYKVSDYSVVLEKKFKAHKIIWHRLFIKGIKDRILAWL